ncbi:MAG TPA: DNA replication and repair protein RecF [Solirubrobacteraceae bacterium]|jgi:DNA replication and repair protein RecF|nr:DNA replication and repair protein RecF [Solirubrobacteraceae bacterium]
MLVEGVELRDFRSYARAHARVGPGLTVVHGANGAGKSNLLEAIYYGCTGHSPRTRNERELIRFGARAARVVVQIADRAQTHELSVGYEAAADGRPAAKRMRCDGADVERMLDVDARPLISVFEPDRLELIKGTPAARRAHLDQLVAALWPSRAHHRREYSRVLAQRNALLARIRSGSASRATLPSWDRELARTALAVSADRVRTVALLAAPFSERAAQLGCRGALELAYRPRSSASSEDEFLAELAARIDRDLERGFSGHGPHRDELSIAREGRELRTYGSQGEQRLALLALLLAERSVLEHERGRLPLMLLDDVMSELDGERRELLVADLAAAGQSVIATTDLAHVPHATASATARLRVGGGSILGEAAAA